MAESSGEGGGGFLAAMGEAAMSLEAVGGNLVSGIAAVLPAFPAARWTDLSLNIMHGHPHPPTFGTPLPSTGPVLSIPIFSTASTVLINGLNAARAGDMGIGAWCGGYFPMYEIFTGSSNVYIESSRASRMIIDFTKHCIFTSRPSPPPSDPPVGNFIGNMITGSPNVQIGGAPIPSLFSIFLGAAAKGLAKLAGKAVKAVVKAAKPRLARAWRFVNCKVLRREPVNIITGEVVVHQQDFALPGRIPLKWHRHYGSQNPRRGLCGYGWETPADARLEFEADGTVSFSNGNPGVTIFLSLPMTGSVVDAVGAAILGQTENAFTVRTKSGLIYSFPKSETNARELLVERVSDLTGNTIAFIRKGGNLIEIRDGSERWIEVTSHNGLIREMLLHHPSEAAPRILVRYAYNDSDDLAIVFDALEAPYRFSYDNHCLTQHTDRNGLSFYYQYDELSTAGRCIRTFGDNGLYDSQLEYSTGQTRVTDSFGYHWTIEYDLDQLPIKEIDPLGGVTLYEYDELGRTTAVVNPEGNRTEYVYDDKGNLLKVTRPDGKSIVTEFNAASNAVRLTGAGGAAWEQEWDSRNLLIRQLAPSGAESSYEYDSRGQLVTFVNPGGARTTFAFDDQRNLRRITDALGHATEFDYDALGNLTGKTDSLGRRTKYAYDLKGRLTRVVMPSGAAVSYTYDAEDNLVLYQNENGAVTRMERCGLGEIKRCHQPDGQTVEYLYDTEERLIRVTNQRGEHYEFKRDAVGRVVEEIDYWGQRWQYAYTPAGYHRETIDPLGRMIRYHTDPLGRILKTLHTDPIRRSIMEEQTFAYDAGGNLIACENQTTRVVRQFDAEGRLLEECQGEQCAVSYTYDQNGNRISRTTKIDIHGQSYAHTVRYRFDALDRAIGVEVNGYEAFRLTRNAVGQITEERLGPRLQRRFFYNLDGDRTVQQVADHLRPIFDQSYTYDAAGNLTEKRDSVYGTERATYDLLGRLTAHLDPQGHLKPYLADPVGDLLKTRPVQGREEGNQADWVWNREGEYEGVRYRFDGAGNLVLRSRPDGDTRFSWDSHQRLIEATASDGRTTRYNYDPLGRRVAKKTEGTVIYFFWDGDSLLNQVTVSEQGEHVPEVKRLREWVYYPGTFEPLAMLQHKMDSGQQRNTSRGHLYFYCTDPNGCPTRVLAAESDVVWSATYEAWGKTRQITVNRVSNPVRLQGQYYDSETELCYNRARYYDPTNGFFISRDPIGLAGGTSLYQYAPNTWRWIDPLGLSCSIHFDYAAALARELFDRSHWMREIQRMAQIDDIAARNRALNRFRAEYRRATGIEIRMVPENQAGQYGIGPGNWGTYSPAEQRIYMHEGIWGPHVNPVNQIGHEVGAAELDRVMGIPKDSIPQVHRGLRPSLTHAVDMMYRRGD